MSGRASGLILDSDPRREGSGRFLPGPKSPGASTPRFSMSVDASSRAAAVPGLMRSDPHGPGITREPGGEGFRYRDPSGVAITDRETMRRIGALVIPPGWTDVWISPDPLGHIQATGVDSRGRTQYRYHQLWREQRDAQKFAHMLRFAHALPALRTATLRDLRRRRLDRDRVVAGAVRLIDLGLFRIGGERYAELDHHYGAATLEKRHVNVTRDGVLFDYIAKEGKRRAITVTDEAIRPTVLALARSGNGLDSLFSWQDGGSWHALHSHDVSNYIAAHVGGALHGQGIPHLERHRADGAAAGERGTGAGRPRAARASLPPASAGWPTGSGTPRPWRAPPTSIRG